MRATSSSPDPAPGPPAPDPLILTLRAAGAQAIVWHHYALYGPMSDALPPQLDPLVDALVDHARYAVQVFLVVAGLLAARVLETRPVFWPALRRRVLRLAPAYWAALAAALLAAALARALIEHDAVPRPPSAWQVIANLLMLQDLAGVEALSAGVWYVAIDLQLYALLLAIAALCPARAARGVVVALALASLAWIGRDAAHDIWAPYFFGSYALGIIAGWSRHDGRWRWAIVLLAALALGLEWRERIALAGAVALALSYGPHELLRLGSRLRALLQYAADRSYELFLLHYPVLLATGAVVHAVRPGDPAANGLGLLLAWALAMAAAHLLHRALTRRDTPSSAAATARSAGTP